MPTLCLHDHLDHLPSFADIPDVPGLPKGCTWGLWDRDGVRDELGTLNFLTADTVKRAAGEIQEGISVSLKLSMSSSSVPTQLTQYGSWSLDKPNIPVFKRQKLGHEIVDNSTFSASASFDDNLSLNTQSGSQWDGLRHVVHRESGKLYNGIRKWEVDGPQASTVLGIDKEWHEKGGLVGRGLLIDYVAFAKRHNIEYSAVDYHAISHSDLDQAAREQGVEFRQGDILLVRTGVTKWYNEQSDTAERDRFFTDPAKASVGVAPTPEAISWLWDHHFSAVAGDALAWEPVPYPKNDPSFHQYLLAMWGTPIGELWDLERLAETCGKLGRWSFFLTSIPLNVPGGVASPPNAVAIF